MLCRAIVLPNIKMAWMKILPTCHGWINISAISNRISYISIQLRICPPLRTCHPPRPCHPQRTCHPTQPRQANAVRSHAVADDLKDAINNNAIIDKHNPKNIHTVRSCEASCLCHAPCSHPDARGGWAAQERWLIGGLQPYVAR